MDTVRWLKIGSLILAGPCDILEADGGGRVGRMLSKTQQMRVQVPSPPFSLLHSPAYLSYGYLTTVKI